VTGHADLGDDPHVVVACVETCVDFHGCGGRCARRSQRRKIRGCYAVIDRKNGCRQSGGWSRGRPSSGMYPLCVEAEPREPTSRQPADGSLPIVRGGRQPTWCSQLEPCTLALGFATTFANEIVELIVGERAGKADNLVPLNVGGHTPDGRHVGLEAEVGVRLSVESVGTRHAIDPDGV
jgi:hypothetical protein